MNTPVNGIKVEDDWETKMQKTRVAVRDKLVEQYKVAPNQEAFFAKTVDILLMDASGMSMVQILVS